MMKTFVVAITGASGSIYGVRMIDELLKAGHKVHLVVSSESFDILKYETEIDWQGKTEKEREKRIRDFYGGRMLNYYGEGNLWAPLSSGSFRTDGMIVLPCSMKTLASISNGYCANLIERAADVTIKEGRTLVLSPRETPLNPIHIENMLKLARLGVKIIPPTPAFYHRPVSIDDLVNFVIGKIFDSLNIHHNLYVKWNRALQV